MNHDDEKNPELQAWIEPELEARLVASVLGEASAFETAELERLLREKPELAIFKRRIEAVHGLVGQAVRAETAPLRLAAERRAKILATIATAPARMTNEGKNAPVLLALAAARKKRRRRQIWGSAFAATLMFGAILAVNFSAWSHREFEKPQGRGYAVSLAKSSQLALDERKREPSAPVTTSLSSPPEDAQQSAGQGIARLRYRQLKEAVQATEPADSSPSPAVQDFATGVVAGDAPLLTMKPLVGPADASASAPEKRPVDLGRIELSSTIEQKNGASEISVNSPPPPAQPDSYKSRPESTDGIVKLSSFEVSASPDRGYAAANTLAGSRPVTDLSGLFKGDAIGSRNSAASTVTFGAGGKKQATLSVTASDHDDNFLQGSHPGGQNQARSSKEVLVSSPAEKSFHLDQQKISAAPRPSQSAVFSEGETRTSVNAVSTFSLHVSDVSFRLAQAALARGETPDPARIRPEEFYNAFDYGDPSPSASDKIACRIEQSAHPLIQQRNLVRIAMKVPAAGRGTGQPLHLTVLLDTSGSMERADRVASVQSALTVLASLLSANDRVTLIGFARQPRLLVEQLPGNQGAQLAEFARRTPFTGGTNLEEALKLSSELARRHRDPAAQNRIVLITDGAANLGNADPAQLATMIETLRQQGIAFDACGVGTDGLDDAVLEALTRKGDGRYYVLDKPEDADAGFARQLAGAFRPAAENVKVQVRFNPARVASYRLIGFEQHRLREEDFRNDKIDAAELAADEAAIALYQVEVLPQGEGELGDVFVRFRDAATGTMVERSWTMRHEPRALAFDRATPSMQLAGMADLLAEKLRGGDAANQIHLDELVPVVNALRGHYANNARVQELVTMFEQMRRRSGK